MTAPIRIPDFTGLSQGRKSPCGQIRLNRSHPLVNKLLACWVMNECGGDTLFDLSGNSFNLTINGGLWTPTGYEHDTISAMASGAIDGFGTSDPLSVFCGLIYTDDNNEGGDFDQIVFSWGTTDRFAAGLLGTTNKPFIFTSGGNTIADAISSLIEGDEYTLGFIFDQPNDRAAVYINGGLDHQNTSYTDNSTETAPTFYVGSCNPSNNTILATYKFMYVFKQHALTDSEIASLHADPYQIFEPVLPLPITPSVAAAAIMSGIYYRTLLQGTP